MELFVAVISGLAVALILWWRSSSSKKKPPGPWGLPIVGYLPFLTSKPYLTFNRLAKRYGNIFSIRLGSRNVVVLNDFQSTKEAFFQDAFIGRPSEFPFEMNKETFDTGAFYGLPWKEQRRHCLHMLRDLGLGKSMMDEFIKEEITELMEYFENNADIPFCMRNRLQASMSNIIASLLFGKRMKYEDPNRKMLASAVLETVSQASQTGWLIFFPWLKKLFDLLGRKSPNADLRTYAMKEIKKHEGTVDPSNIRDFVDSYILEIQKRKDDPAFSTLVLQDMVTAFFTGGSDTVRQSIEWFTLIAASNQKAQRRIQAEIQEVIGPNRLPTLPDRNKMPYTDAFIMEAMRWRTLVPVNLLRLILVDTELNGYFIPKNTLLLSNTWAIHNDPEYWGPDAEEFRPERFLKEDGKEVKKMDRFMPFSIGKRSCPGEPLAKIELFLYFVSILQRFDVKLPDGKVADFEGELGATLQPKAQDLVFTKRS